MNPNTRVAVCCYAGDQRQVIQSLGLYLHHECPVVIMSPGDAPAEIRYPGVENRVAGKRAYFGPDAQARHLVHLKLLLTFPENHFLMHESDSFCLDPKIPDYLYADPHRVWANTVDDEDAAHQAALPADCPHVSFQAPWFLSRKTIEALIAAADRVTYSPDLKYVDLYLVQLTYAAGLPWSGFLNQVCCPIAARDDDQNLSQWQRDTYAVGLQIGLNHARDGANMVHSVKNPAAAQALLRAYDEGKSHGTV
jgi:hypothetical protein